MGKTVVLITLILLFALPVPAGALELYMRRTVFLAEAIPTIAELVHAGPGQSDSAVLQTRLPFAVQRLTLLPAATIRQVLSEHYTGVLVIAGGRTALLPPELAVLPEAGFYRDLLHHIDATEEQRKGRVELEFLDDGSCRPRHRSILSEIPLTQGWGKDLQGGAPEELDCGFDRVARRSVWRTGHAS